MAEESDLAMSANGILRHESPAPSADHLREGPRVSAKELRNQELVHAYGAACCQMVEWIRHAESHPRTRLEALARIADVAAFHHHRLKLELDG